MYTFEEAVDAEVTINIEYPILGTSYQILESRKKNCLKVNIANKYMKTDIPNSNFKWPGSNSSPIFINRNSSLLLLLL